MNFSKVKRLETRNLNEDAKQSLGDNTVDTFSLNKLIPSLRHLASIILSYLGPSELVHQTLFDALLNGRV